MTESHKHSKNPGDNADIICVICPNSCRLHVEVESNGEIKVEGYQCKRGLEYGAQEFISPTRMLITTMRIENGFLPVIPVRSNVELPKERIFEAVKVVNDSVAKAPIKMGDILIKNIFNLGIDVISSRDMIEKQSP